MAELAALETPFDIERADVLEGVLHGFFGSGGGAHQFGYGGIGAESEEGPEEAENVRMLRSAAASAILSGAPLATPHQVHSPNVITLGKLWPDAAEGRGVADAVVTDRTDIVLGIITADCGPILLADRDAGVVGAAHAGWRGAHGGVLENTIAAMEALGATRKNIAAALGPTIAQESYEVDAEFRDNFGAIDYGHFADAPMRDGKARWHFDLPSYILGKLERAGLSEIAALGRDTYANNARYFSYRKAVQSGAETYGRQLSAIAVGGAIR